MSLIFVGSCMLQKKKNMMNVSVARIVSRIDQHSSYVITFNRVHSMMIDLYPKKTHFTIRV